MHIGQEKLDTPALHSQLILYQNDGASVVSGLRAGNEPDFVAVITLQKYRELGKVIKATLCTVE